jgi:hypothetical protein
LETADVAGRGYQIVIPRHADKDLSITQGLKHTHVCNTKLDMIAQVKVANTGANCTKARCQLPMQLHFTQYYRAKYSCSL